MDPKVRNSKAFMSSPRVYFLTQYCLHIAPKMVASIWIIEIDQKLNGEIENNQVRINSAVDVITTDADGNRARFVADADGNRARAAADAARVNQHDSQLSS